MSETQQAKKRRKAYAPNEPVRINLSAIPQHICDSISATLHDELAIFYSVPENMAAYEAWLTERNANSKI